MRTLSYIGLFALIFAQYVTTAIPGYLALLMSLLLGAGIRLPSRIVLYICAVAVYWLAVLSYGAGKSVFTHMLFYFGFLIPYLTFATGKRISVDSFVNEKVIVALCLLIIVEAVLFNSPIGPHLYYFPEVGAVERTAILGFYQRPVGIGGNAAMTSTILFFLVILNEQIRGASKFTTQVLIFAAAILLASGTALGFLLFYLAVLALRSRAFSVKYYLLRFVYVLVFISGIAVIYGYFGTFEQFDRFTIDYVQFLLDYKLLTLERAIEVATLDTALFGYQIHDIVATTGDSGFLVSVDAVGLIGAALLFMAPLLYPGAVLRNAVPSVLFYLSFIHYPGLLTPPGQILLACYLCILSRSSGKTEESPASRSSGMPGVRAAPARS